MKVGRAARKQLRITAINNVFFRMGVGYNEQLERALLLNKFLMTRSHVATFSKGFGTAPRSHKETC